MHRKLLLAIVLGIVLFTARYASAPQPGPDTTGREIVFTRKLSLHLSLPRFHH